uniref:Uncharacterized protein n=1 Tax=Mycena chlorophos TaxID=658473 RepID=A0ABQ0KZC4_MYCCL|nr:predicted protein [Mycena chlorophos]
MATSSPTVLSASQRDDLIALGYTIRDTKHGTLAERDASLVKAAEQLLKFRAQVASFVESQALGNAVFIVRNEMTRNNFRRGGPFGRVFSDVILLAAAINDGRRKQRIRRQASAERAHAAQAAADRQARLEALEYASRLKEWHASPHYTPSASSEPVSLSDGEGEPKVINTDVPKPATAQDWSPSSPIGPQITSRSLSPIEADLRGLDALIAEMRLTCPAGPVRVFYLILSPSSRVCPARDPNLSDTLVDAGPGVRDGQLSGDKQPQPKPIPTEPRADRQRLPNFKHYPKRPRSASPVADTAPEPARSDAGSVCLDSRPDSLYFAVPPPARRRRLPPSEYKLRRRLADLDATLRRLSCERKCVAWQLQTLLADAPGTGSQQKPAQASRQGSGSRRGSVERE